MIRRTLGALVLAVAVGAAQAQPFDLSWYTIDGGGAMNSSGGSFVLSGTIGQPDAGVMTGGSFQLVGGFWGGASAGGELLADMNCDGLVNFDDIDAFVLALVGQGPYEATFPTCNYFNGDIDGNGAVNFDDIDGFIECLIFSSCP